MGSFRDGFYTGFGCLSGAVEMVLDELLIEEKRESVTLCYRSIERHHSKNTQLVDSILYGSGAAFGMVTNIITFPLGFIVAGTYDGIRAIKNHPDDKYHSLTPKHLYTD